MTHADSPPLQKPAAAVFLGAQRAEQYFEEAPTETVRAAVAPAVRGVIAHVPDHLTTAPQIGHETATTANAESVLRRVVHNPGVLDVPRGHPQPSLPAPAVSYGRRRWGRRREAAAELEQARATIRLSTWPRSAGILVANPKGSVGKTPTSLLLGGVIAHIRGGQTIVLEVTDDPGSLALRAEGPARAGLGELVRDVSAIRGAGALAGYCAQQTSFAAVVGSPHDRGPLRHADVDNVNELLEYFYPVRIMDSGNQVTSSAFHGAVRNADVLVIPVVDAVDAVAGAELLLRQLRRIGGHPAQLAADAIVLRLDDGRRTSPDARQHVTHALTAAGMTTVIDVPFDPHIAERSTLTLDRLRPATTSALTRAAAAVCERLTARLR